MSHAPGAIADAARHLGKGDFAGAERIADEILRASQGRDADALHILGLVRAAQGRFDEAKALLERSLAARPRQPQAQCNLGKVLARLDRTDEAVAAFRACLKLAPDLFEALFELGDCLKAAGRLGEAEQAYRKLLRLRPGDAAAKLRLGDVLIAACKLDEAETALRRGLGEPGPDVLKARLHAGLAEVRLRQGREDDALADLEQAARLDPALRGIDLRRAELLHDMKRYDEALALYRAMIAREPLNLSLHNDYNDLLYRLGRREDYLKSFDWAAPVPALQLSKATFLMHGRRYDEAHDVFAAMLAREPGDKHAGTGLATALSRLGRHDEAAAMFEQVIARHDGDANLCANAASAFIAQGDVRRALALCERGHALAPGNQVCLALMSTALRILGDSRDEILSGYETLIRAFDLEPPDGFSDMAAFNAELDAYLDRLHPHTGEHIAQSLRGGSQTIAEVFGAGHDLIDRLQQRITEAVNQYVAELKADENHPFLSRKARGFAYAGSWSSRLHDNGFHANHLHPGGWISSAYYVAVPEAARDENTREGWIKFGEPDMATRLADPVRRVIRPVPGRLVLFPSYMWHGTVPFRSPTARTTIAFDAVPDE